MFRDHCSNDFLGAAENVMLSETARLAAPSGVVLAF
jgi:hypothetical protein